MNRNSSWVQGLTGDLPRGYPDRRWGVMCLVVPKDFLPSDQSIKQLGSSLETPELSLKGRREVSCQVSRMKFAGKNRGWTSAEIQTSRAQV